LENLAAGAVAFEFQRDGFRANSFWLREIEDLNFPAGDETDFSRESLEKFLPEKTNFFVRGLNLQKSSDDFQRAVARGNSATKILLLARARAILHEFFAGEISLENDIFPLFADEFSFGATRAGELFAILRTADEVFATQKREKLIAGFEKFLKTSAGEIVEFTADGRVFREVFPRENLFSKKESTIGGAILVELSAGDETFAIGQKGAILIAATDGEPVREILKNLAEDLPERNLPKLVEFFSLPTFDRFDEIASIEKSFWNNLPAGFQFFTPFAPESLSVKSVRGAQNLRVDFYARYLKN